jgi:hypothetical protein
MAWLCLAMVIACLNLVKFAAACLTSTSPALVLLRDPCGLPGRRIWPVAVILDDCPVETAKLPLARPSRETETPLGLNVIKKPKKN